MATNRPLIGLDMLYYVELLTDDSTEATYDTPVRIYNTVSLSVNPNTTIATFFADDGPKEAYSQMGEVDVSIQVADLPPDDLAFLIGADYDSDTGVMDYDTSASPPEVAIGFRAQKSNGYYRYVWLMKGRFGLPEMSHQTKEGSVNFQTQVINGKFLAREYDNLVFKRVDEDDDNCTLTLPADWFNSPDLGAAAAALALSSVSPLHEATDVELDATIEWTFDDDVFAADVTSDNFSVYDTDAADFVSGTLGFDPVDDSIVVFTPDSDLAASTLHVVNVEAGVRNTSGGALATQEISTFTTGAGA